MVAKSTTKKGRRGAQTPTGDALTPPPGAAGSPGPRTRGADSRQPPDATGALTVPGQTPAGAPAGDPAGVAQFEAMVQALNTLPADIRRALTVQMGVPPPATSAASQRYDDERLDSFYANCISPYIPEDLRSDFDSVEWSDVGTLFSRVCHSLELRKPGEDEKLKELLHGYWFEQRLDTRSKAQPAHVLELFKKKPEAAAADKVYRELQDGPLRDLLKLVLHMGVRATKPDQASSSSSAAVDSLRSELITLKTEARTVSVLAFSLLSEIQAARRKLMWEVTGAKAHELGGVSLWTPDDAATLHRIVDHRDWQAKMLPKIAKPSGGRGRGNRTGRGRGRGGRRNDTRPSGGRSSEGRKDSESSTHAADAAAEPASATKATPRKTGPKKGSGKGKGK
jgi:hypothetical protein